MSDVTIAPPSAAPSTSPPTNNQATSSPPSSHQVPVNENPVHTPNPVGSQAVPVKHDRDPKASIKAAFDRANNPDKARQEATSRDKSRQEATKPAEAKAGHNQPPEETEKFDLKKRPSDAPRGERGQFAPRNVASGEQTQNERLNSSFERPRTEQEQYKRLPSHAPFAEPPQRISERARRDWADTPETVRGDMHRMHHEFSQAYQQYRGAAEAFAPVARFHQMAQRHNTTLEKALESYTGIEALLRKNVVAGLDQIVNNLGLTDPQTNQRIGFRDVAYHVLSQSPEQLQQVQMGNQQMAASHQLAAANQRIERLENEHRQMQYAQQYAQRFHYTRSAVDQFAEQHPRIDEKEFGEVVKREIELGFPLDVAYQRAERLHPATHAAQTGTTPAQTRTPDRSIHGSPDVAPSNGASRKPKQPSKSPAEAVQNALKRMNGYA